MKAWPQFINIILSFIIITVIINPRIKNPSSLKAQEDFIETEVAEDVLYKDLVAVFTPQVIALRLHTAGKK